MVPTTCTPTRRTSPPLRPAFASDCSPCPRRAWPQRGEMLTEHVAAALWMAAHPGLRAGEAQHEFGEAEQAFLAFLGCRWSHRGVGRAVAERIAECGLELR